METYKKSEFIANGIFDDFIQDNHSKSSKGVLRGLHYQIALSAKQRLYVAQKEKYMMLRLISDQIQKHLLNM